MRTALLFCGARRTALCQRTLEKSGFAPQIVRFSDDTHAVAALEGCSRRRTLCAF